MSHELMTPLNGIMGIIHLITETDLTFYQKEQLNKAANEARGLVAVLNDILNFSSLDSGKVNLVTSEFLLEPAVKAVAEALAKEADQKGLEFFIQITPLRHSTIVGDPMLLKKILNNLIHNAIKFTERGHVAVRVQELKPSEVITAGRVMLIFSVKDTGMGLTETEKARLFTVFTQVDSSSTRKFGGTGLGLAFARKAVEMLGGRIWCDSKVGEGSTFHFTIPLQVVTPEKDLLESEKIFRGRPALIIAPDGPQRDNLKSMFNYFGLATSVAGDETSAIKQLGNLEDGKVFVAIDIKMIIDQGMNLYGLLLSVRDKAPDLEMLFIIVHPKGDFVREDIRYNRTHLEKPYTTMSVFEALVKANDKVKDEP
jgi:hypothetical protein